MGPVNYNTQFLIRTDKCILIETPPGDEFRKKEDQAEDKRKSSEKVQKTLKVKGMQEVLKQKELWETAVQREQQNAGR